MNLRSPSKIVIIGGGLVGLAVAYRYLRRFPGRSVVLLEKEDTLCRHQSGRNSGVIHTGVYYDPKSLKAKNCTEGRQQLLDFCDQHDIPYDLTGKIIVALNEKEERTLQTFAERAEVNGVSAKLIGKEELREHEPHVAGIAALHVRGAGVIDYTTVGEALAQNIQALGAKIRCNFAVSSIDRSSSTFRVTSRTGGQVEAAYLINCAGLYADTIVELCGLTPKARIIPFRGEYYALNKSADHLCKKIIYPVPDISLPFLGVHITRMIDGTIEAGPNAVLAFAREGYSLTSLNLAELWKTVGYAGFYRFVSQYLAVGAHEFVRSMSRRLFLRSLRRLIPAVKESHLGGTRAGVRAQAITPDGKMAKDFLIQQDAHSLHVLSAPSPAATSCLRLGETVVAMVEDKTLT